MSGPRVLDLRPYACPLTYVKTRIALERLGTGERLELWLSAGEPVESVPRSAAEEGHRVISVEPLGGGGLGLPTGGGEAGAFAGGGGLGLPTGGGEAGAFADAAPCSYRVLLEKGAPASGGLP